MNVLIVRYGEIALKGKNRKIFEKKLASHIKAVFKSLNAKSQMKRYYGRITFEFDSNLDKELLSKKLKKIPGIHSFSIGISKKFESFEKTWEFIKPEVDPFIREYKNFRIKAKRINKKLDFSSVEVERFLGSKVVEEYGLDVKLKNPEYSLNLEFIGKLVIFFPKIEKGIGGIPLGSEGKGLSLLSGGFDSPVASVLAIKRGIRVDFVHFMSVVEDQKEVLKKIYDLMDELKGYQIKCNLFLVPFLPVQKYISLNFPDSHRVIFLRRAFLYLASKLAKKEGYKCLITGDNIGQVSSQTLDNMASISKISETMIIRPLICYDKYEIMDLSRKYGLYDISARKHDDLCSLFNPTNPATKTDRNFIESEEEEFYDLIDFAIEKIEVKEFSLV